MLLAESGGALLLWAAFVLVPLLLRALKSLTGGKSTPRRRGLQRTLDQLLGEDEAGAAHIGTVELTTALYYNYAVVNVNQLSENIASLDVSVSDGSLRWSQGLLVFAAGSIVWDGMDASASTDLTTALTGCAVH